MYTVPFYFIVSSTSQEKLTVGLSTFGDTPILFYLIIIIMFIFLLPHSQAKTIQAQLYDNVFIYLSSERAAAAEQDNCSMLVILGFSMRLKRGE